MSPVAWIVFPSPNGFRRGFRATWGGHFLAMRDGAVCGPIYSGLTAAMMAAGILTLRPERPRSVSREKYVRDLERAHSYGDMIGSALLDGVER